MTFLYRIHRKKHSVVDQSRDESIPNVQENLEKKPIEMEDKIGRQQVFENIGRSAYLVVNNITTLHFRIFLSNYWLTKIRKKKNRKETKTICNFNEKKFIKLHASLFLFFFIFIYPYIIFII